MGSTSFNSIQCNKEIKNIFVDFFDTIVHRSVHPNQVVRLWAKIMIRELGLDLKVDELYFIRKASSQYLAEINKLLYFEIDYNELIAQVYHRLISTSKINDIAIEDFTTYFELAETRAEINVQYLNKHTTKNLRYLKKNGYTIYCISDFYTSSHVLKKLLQYHNIDHLFDDVFVSADYQKSKSSGHFYPFLLEKLNIKASNVAMIGDSLTSDIKNAQANNLMAIHIPNNGESKTKTKYLIGSDQKDYHKLVKVLCAKCNNGQAPPNSDYIFFYAVYIERLYHQLKRKGIQDIFFLAREGLFLKRMFDHYQNHVALKKEDYIKTHYFKCSRQASMLVSLKDVDEENYTFLRRKYPDLSPGSFLRNFTFSKDLVTLIFEELGFHEIKDKIIPDFLESEVFYQIRQNETFRAAYNKNSKGQKKAFEAYLESFAVDFETDGMHLADIGWGGSMQECLYDYFNEKVEVNAYYLGLNEVYTIQKDTPRWGLNFSIFPYSTYSDNILRGNTELNEQLLSAGHGSTLSYNHLETFTNEYHHEIEKKIFHEHIFEIQEFMFDRYKEFLVDLDSICYDHDIVQKEMTDYAMRIGLFASKRKVAAAAKIAEGFYTNVGDFSNGLKISPKKYSKSKFKLLKTFVLAPDRLFSLILRVKPYLYKKKKYYLAYLIPWWLIYLYIRINRGLKIHMLKDLSRFKFDYLR